MQLRQRKLNVLVVSAIDRIGRSLPHLNRQGGSERRNHMSEIRVRRLSDIPEPSQEVSDHGGQGSE